MAIPVIEYHDLKEWSKQNYLRLSKPLHIMVGEKSDTIRMRNFQSHVSSIKLPFGSFIEVDKNLAVCSPELTFLQMASKLSLVGLIQLGYELCGTYRIDRTNTPERGFRDDIPLTSIDKLTSYINKVEGFKGIKNARRALGFICMNSASPMETVLAILLCLPYRMGGYSLPKPSLNSAIKVPSTSHIEYKCDLFWPKTKVAVEYDSDAYHTGSDRINQDAIRRNALLAAKINLIIVTRKQIYATNAMNNIAYNISKLVGKRTQNVPSDFAKRQTALKSQLLPNAYNGI